LERRAEIQRLIEEAGDVPKVREMARVLNEKGFQGNHQTVFKDYQALGIKWDRQRQAKPKPLSLLLYAGIGRQESEQVA
jgi:hypothetical protein